MLLSGPTLWNMTLIHVNDMHVRIEETNKYSSECDDKARGEGTCFGGMARLAAQAQKVKDEEENVVWLNAGDLFQGTIWYTIHVQYNTILYNILLIYN